MGGWVGGVRRGRWVGGGNVIEDYENKILLLT